MEVVDKNEEKKARLKRRKFTMDGDGDQDLY